MPANPRTHGADPYGEPVDIDTELRVETDASIWTLRADQYLRLPKIEGPRVPGESADLADARWHRHEGVWRVVDTRGTRYRILPAGRPPGSGGILTGDVLTARAFPGRRGRAVAGPKTSLRDPGITRP